LQRPEQITLRQLRALQAVAENGTISGAAQMLGLTGPAVHSQLKSLEEIVGAAVIQREGRQPTVLTPQGEALLRAHAEVHATLERALQTVDALNHGRTGRVVLGAVSTAKYFAPRIVAMLETEFPGIEIALQVANRSDTIVALQNRELDLCIMGRPPRAPLTEATVLADHPHVLIAPPGHPLTGRDRITDRDLKGHRFVLREEGSGTRLLASRYLAQLDEIDRPKSIVMDSNETIKQAVMYGMGIALISAHTVAEEVAGGRLAVLRADRTPILRSWYLLTPMDFAPSTAALRVRDWLVEHAPRFIPSLDLGAVPTG
jgi:molybdate transport repressor ModE-like protein